MSAHFQYAAPCTHSLISSSATQLAHCVLASCNCMEGPQRVTLGLFRSLSLVRFTRVSPSSRFSTYCSACEWTWLPYPASCSFYQLVFRYKQGSGFCVGSATLIWRGRRRRSAACCSRCSKLRRPHLQPPRSPRLLAAATERLGFHTAQSAFLHGQRAQNYATLLQFQQHQNPAQRSLSLF